MQSANSSSSDVIEVAESPADSASHPRVQGARSRREYALGQWPLQVGDIHVQHVDRGPRR